MGSFFLKEAWDHVCLVQNLDEAKQQPMDGSKDGKAKLEKARKSPSIAENVL